MGAISHKIATLEAELEKLKALTPTPPMDRAAEGKWRDAMHQQAEVRMSHAAHFTRDQLEEMRRAAPDDVCRDLARDARAPLGPKGMLRPSQPVGNRGPDAAPARGSGWAPEVPLGPMPGVAQADRLMDEQDRRDRHELMLAEAKRLAAQKPK